MIIDNDKLKEIIIEALRLENGSAQIIPICKYVWDNYESDLKKSGDRLYDWQYKIRWAAHSLRKDGIMKSKHESLRGVWELTDEYFY